MYNNKIVYKVFIWVFVGIILWNEKVALSGTVVLDMVGIPADQNSPKMEVHMQYLKSCILNFG